MFVAFELDDSDIIDRLFKELSDSIEASRSFEEEEEGDVDSTS